MRPPEFTGGNAAHSPAFGKSTRHGFNEAAGIHRRKHNAGAMGSQQHHSFNEAAGIHRRKRVSGQAFRPRVAPASMRPPEFTGGNRAPHISGRRRRCRFNEAAGIHRRKPRGP